MIRAPIISGFLLVAAPVVAQPAPAPAAAAVDPARLKAAQALVAQITPPGQREAMIHAVVGPMFANMRQTLTQDPNFAKLVGDDPRVQALMDHFIDRVGQEARASIAAGLPKMYEAMAIAYARQFTVAQLDEVRAFYASPTGHEFTSRMPQVMADPAVVQAQRDLMSGELARMPAIMADPAVVQAQRDLMSGELARMPAIMADLKAEIAKLGPPKAPPR